MRSSAARSCWKLRVVCGKMAQIQDANWLIALLSLAAMLMGAACQFCTASFDLQPAFPSRRAAQQLFVTASLEQLLLYVLNLVVMAILLPQDQLKLVPILVAMFVFARWGMKERGSSSQYHEYLHKISYPRYFNLDQSGALRGQQSCPAAHTAKSEHNHCH